jgi:DnaJ-domain-containing protein 1
MSADDPFDLLKLVPSFGIDPAAVRRARVRAVATADEGSGDAARWNDAQVALLDPFSRAEILLRRLGAPEVDRRLLPDGFLLEMIELREEADAADAAGRAALRARAEEARRAALGQVGAIFDAALQGSGLSVETTEDIWRGLNAARSFDRMIEQLDRESG